jgi:hypothetical protein
MLIGVIDSESAALADEYLWRDKNAKGVQRDMPPEWLFGSRKMFLDACENSHLRHTHISAYLAYSESQHIVKRPLQQQHLMEFARLLRGGLPEWRAPSVGVSHPRFRGLDLHLEMSKTDLWSHRQLPLWSGTGEEVFRTWRRTRNLESNLSDPDDEWLKRFFEPVPKSLSTQDGRLFRERDMQIATVAGEGWIWNRGDLLSTIEADNWRIASVDDVGVTMIPPSGTRLRFQGGKYAKGFHFPRIVDARNMDAKREPKAVERELKKLRPRLSILEEQRFEYFAHRFGAEPLTAPSKAQAAMLRAYASSKRQTLSPSASISDDAAIGADPSNFRADPRAVETARSGQLVDAIHPSDERNKQQSDCSELTRIRRERQQFASAIDRGIGAALSGVGNSLQQACDSVERAGADVRDASCTAHSNLNVAGGLLDAVEQLSNKDGGRRNRPDFERDLDIGRVARERARRAIDRHLVAVDPLAALRDKKSGLLRFDMIRPPQPQQEVRYEL